MIIGGALLLFSLLFGVGDIEIFFIAEVDKSVKKYVEDKDRRAVVLDSVKAYSKAVKTFRKSRDAELKELKKKNLDRSTPQDWYENFFSRNLENRLAAQSRYIERRLWFEEQLTDEEWQKVLESAVESATKLDNKEKKKAMKDRDKNVFRGLESAIVREVGDEERRFAILDALRVFELVYDETIDNMDRRNVLEMSFLTDQTTSKEEMQQVMLALDELRTAYYVSFRVFFFVLRDQTQEDEWKPIVKEFNKLIV